MIIAFSGAKFAGKDSAANGLIRSFGFKRIGLADKLKTICSTIFELKREDMDDPFKKEEPFSSPLQITEEHLNTLFKILTQDGFDVTDENIIDISSQFRNKKLSSIRNVLQVIGTDICRNFIKDDIWLSYVKKDIAEQNVNVVITDARFENERKFLKELGATLILVKRPGFEPKDSHASENQLGNDFDYDVVVNNVSTIGTLQSEICMWYTVMKDAIPSNRR
jgi:hypothetical protein